MHGWEGGTGVHATVHELPQPAVAWIASATTSERALPSGPRRVKLRHVKRSPGLVVESMLAAATGYRFKV